MCQKQIQPGEKVSLKLTVTERKLVLEELLCLDEDYEQLIRSTSPREPVMLTLDELDDFGGYVAAEANHCEDKRKKKKLDTVFEKIQDLLGQYTDAEPPQTFKIDDARKDKVISDQAVQIAEFAAQALVAAEQLRIKTKPLENFWLAPGQRETLLLVSGLSKTIKRKLANDSLPFTVSEVASMTMSLGEDLPAGDSQKQMALLLVARHMMDRLQEGIMKKAKPAPGKKKPGKRVVKSAELYQFKVTLIDSEPPVWRRIQVKNCTLDKLHEHIQTAMGWANSHLHQIEIDGERYGDPELLDDGFVDFHCVDSTVTRISEIVPGDGQRFQFLYEYDFGDGWEHDVLFEGCLQAGPGIRCPRCLEGERACPPEDVGGVWGYAEFLEAINDPQHEQHEDFVQWAGPFDPEEFNAEQTTKAMRRGLPDWRQ